MKQRNVTILFLLLVSMLMLAVEVAPHHHHNGVPCLRTSETEQSDAPLHHEGKCKCDCFTAFYAAQTNGHTHHESYCNHFPNITLLADLITSCLFLTESSTLSELPVYIENLHDVRISCPFGLRAPPVFA